MYQDSFSQDLSPNPMARPQQSRSRFRSRFDDSTARMVFRRAPLRSESSGADVVRRPGMAGARRSSNDEMSALLTLRRLVQDDRLELARELLRVEIQRFGMNPALELMWKLLSPPELRVTKFVDRSRAEEFGWIRSNRTHFRGRWVALDGGELIASAASLRELRAALTREQVARNPLVHRVV